MKTKKAFRKRFVRKFGKNYEQVVRSLRKDAEWDHPQFYGSARFLQIAEGLKKAVAAQDVLDKLGEPYAVTQGFLFQTGRDVPEFKRWARTRDFVKEWYAAPDEDAEREARRDEAEDRRREKRDKHRRGLKNEALRFK
jgi:hypothetical protein